LRERPTQQFDGLAPAVCAREISSDGMLSRTSFALGGVTEQCEKLAETDRLLRFRANVAIVTRQVLPPLRNSTLRV